MQLLILTHLKITGPISCIAVTLSIFLVEGSTSAWLMAGRKVRCWISSWRIWILDQVHFYIWGPESLL